MTCGSSSRVDFASLSCHHPSPDKNNRFSQSDVPHWKKSIFCQACRLTVHRRVSEDAGQQTDVQSR